MIIIMIILIHIIILIILIIHVIHLIIHNNDNNTSIIMITILRCSSEGLLRPQDLRDGVQQDALQRVAGGLHRSRTVSFHNFKFVFAA